MRTSDLISRTRSESTRTRSAWDHAPRLVLRRWRRQGDPEPVARAVRRDPRLEETIGDYQLHAGDLLRLRILDRSTGRFRVVPFHVEGVVQEFPSAPHDSFMVANLAYLQAADRAGRSRTSSSLEPPNRPGGSDEVAQATTADGTIVKDVTEQTQQTGQLDHDRRSARDQPHRGGVHGPLAAAAMVLFVALALIERRHEFATMAAVGASIRTIGAFVWSEAVLVLAAALLLAAGLEACPRADARRDAPARVRSTTGRAVDTGLPQRLAAAGITATLPC